MNYVCIVILYLSFVFDVYQITSIVRIRLLSIDKVVSYANNKILKYSKGANFLKKKKLDSLLGGEHQSTTSSILGNNRKRDSIFQGENL